MCRLKFPVESSRVSIRNIRPASQTNSSTTKQALPTKKQLALLPGKRKRKRKIPPRQITFWSMSLHVLTAWSLASFSGPVHAPKPQSPRQVSTPHPSHPSSHLTRSITHSAASSPQSQGILQHPPAGPSTPSEPPSTLQTVVRTRSAPISSQVVAGCLAYYTNYGLHCLGWVIQPCTSSLRRYHLITASPTSSIPNLPNPGR